MAGREGVGEFEQLVLLVAVRLGDRAFAPEIARELEETADRRVTRGALYSTLSRLEEKGLVRWEQEALAPERGGSGRRRFEVTSPGLSALRERRGTLLTLWQGIESILDGGDQ